MTTCEKPHDRARAGLAIEYNHDLNVSEAFLEAFPLLRGVLRDERLLTAFRGYDGLAIYHKRWFHVWGLLSLWLGLAPLVCASVRMMAGEQSFAPYAAVVLGAELCGVAAVCCILWNRLRGHRTFWCEAVFIRERLRQWHFQKFLDGKFIELAGSDPPAFEQERARRWAEFEHSLHDGYGLMADFLQFGNGRRDLYHPGTSYSNSAVCNDVMAALLVLRFNHQLRYSRRKVEPESERGGFALREQTGLSESIATMSLGAAVVAGSLSAVVSLVHVAGVSIQWNPVEVTRILGGFGLLLAMVSAASRAYRAGFTLPAELESYEGYCDRLRELKAVFESVDRPQERLHQLMELEQEAASELRSFLRAKTRANFVW